MIDYAKFYAYACRVGADPIQRLHVLPEDVFRVLKKHESSLESGNIPPAAQDAFDKMFDCEDVFSNASPKQMGKIPDDHFVYVALC